MLSLYILNVLSVNFNSQSFTINYKIKFPCHYKKRTNDSRQLIHTQPKSLNTSSLRKNEVLRQMANLI